MPNYLTLCENNKCVGVLGVPFQVALSVPIFLAMKNRQKGFPLQSLTQIELRFWIYDLRYAIFFQ
jgi:hypothetical protein